MPESGVENSDLKLKSKSFLLTVFFYAGLEEWGLRLLKRFRWGETFYDLNRELLDEYASCKNGEEVVAKQQEWMEKLVVEDRERKEYGEDYCMALS